MGQYYLICNLDKRQVLSPSQFGSGQKLKEFGYDGNSVLLGLALLTASGNGRGGGDICRTVRNRAGKFLRIEVPEISGTWAGDRIVTAGDDGPPCQYVTRRDYQFFRQAWRKKNREAWEEPKDPCYKRYRVWEHFRLYQMADYCYADVSQKVLAALAYDERLASHFKLLQEMGDLDRLPPCYRRVTLLPHDLETLTEFRRRRREQEEEIRERQRRGQSAHYLAPPAPAPAEPVPTRPAPARRGNTTRRILRV